MAQIQSLLRRMHTLQKHLLLDRQAAADANLRQTSVFALVGSAGSATMLVWVFALLIRENQRRQRAEGALQKINVELETRVKQRTAELTQALTEYQRAEQQIKK